MIGDKDNSLLCDFMTCGYKCKPFNGKISNNEITLIEGLYTRECQM